MKPRSVRISAFFGEFSLFSENFCIRGVSDWSKLKKSSFKYWKLFLECFSMIPTKNLNNWFWNFWSMTRVVIVWVRIVWVPFTLFRVHFVTSFVDVVDKSYRVEHKKFIFRTKVRGVGYAQRLRMFKSRFGDWTWTSFIRLFFVDVVNVTENDNGWISGKWCKC